MRRFMSVLCAAAAVQLAPAVARANSEIIAVYDARSAGMAYTGVAFADTATAILHNPANLTEIKRLSIDVSFNPAILQLTSQAFTGVAATPGVSKTTPFLLNPLGFVGVAYRGHPRVALGVGALIMDAAGVQYKDAPFSIYGNPAGGTVLGDATAAQLSYEVRIPIALKVTDWLSVAGAYRMTLANQWGNFKSGDQTLLSQKYSGNNFSSAQAGIMIKPMPQLQFGLNYRSRTKVDLNGPIKALTQAGLQTTQGSSSYVAPHQFTAGVATRLLDQKMLLTGEFKYWMYKDAYAGSHDHQDAMSGNLGFEYHLTRHVPIRAGYFVGRSAVKDEAATAFTSAPKLQMGGSVGSGAHFDYIDVDASVGYGEAGGQVTENTLPGNYHMRVVAFAVSASVKL